MVLYRGIYDVVDSTIIIGMFRYIIIIIDEVPTYRYTDSRCPDFVGVMQVLIYRHFIVYP